MWKELIVLRVKLMKILGRVVGGTTVVKRAERYGLVGALGQDLDRLAR